jgi:hypothetical protein
MEVTTMYAETNETMTRDEAFEELERRGVTRAVVNYSGGNDEGGVDSIYLYRSEAKGRDPEHTYLTNPVWGYLERRYGDGIARVPEVDEDGRYVMEVVESTDWQGKPYTHKTHKTRPATEEEIADTKLYDALSAPVYEQWHSFAGDFYVNATVTWHTKERTVVDDHYGMREV